MSLHRLLIDENLSPLLAVDAQARFHDAMHVRVPGLVGAPDYRIVAYAFGEDRILVTNDRDDFLRHLWPRPLACGACRHPAGDNFHAQRAAFATALDVLEARGDLINGVLEIDRDGKAVAFDFPLPNS